ncbi:phosphate/phosphite/phosphonate ABC transporter substrate-binding protein [Pseudomonas lalucatii]|nr:phosphate/phosphite/phosphonate ABC transporter substrate-binding protein [Pseudomonas lalucatii]QVM86709.1 phosphate/phosphite/phosphonate ABC transporter substrate-binding protein [Pseudomonas lalucatii]
MSKPRVTSRHPFLPRAVLLLGLGLAQTSGAQVLTLGVVPQQPAAKLYSLWQPLIEQVRSASGIELVFKTAADIPAFEDALHRGDYDLAYMNPYHYSVFSRASGYNALAAQSPGRLKGLIVVRRDSRFKRLEDLAGEQMVFPSPAAFAASLLTRRELAARGIPVAVKFVRSHDSVYFNVQRGFAAAGGGVRRTLDSTSPAARESLRVLWQSPGYPPHPIAAHPRVGPARQLQVQQALIDLSASARGRQLLKN